MLDRADAAVWTAAAAISASVIVPSRAHAGRSWPGDEAAHLGHDLRDRPDVGQVVQRHGNVEMIFQFAHEFENLERVESQVGQQLALERRLDRTPADALENLDGVLLEPVGGAGSLGYWGQARKCSMNGS